MTALTLDLLFYGNEFLHLTIQTVNNLVLFRMVLNGLLMCIKKKNVIIVNSTLRLTQAFSCTKEKAVTVANSDLNTNT